MKNRFRFLPAVFLLVALVMVSSLDAQVTEVGRTMDEDQDINNRRIGSASATELLIPVGARDMAMGGASIAVTQGVEAIHWNPAGLARLGSSAEAIFSSLSYLADINLNYGAIGASFGRLGVVAVSIRSLDFGDIPMTSNDDPEGDGGRTFSPAFITAGLSYAIAFSDRANAGATIKVVSEKMGRVQGSAVAVDLGVQYHSVGGISGLDMGVAMKNFGPEVAFRGTGLLRRATSSEGRRAEQYYSLEPASFQLPSVVEIGVTYDMSLGEGMGLTTSGAFVNNNLALNTFRVGSEISMNVQKASLFGRGGMEFATKGAMDEYIFGPTVGFGLNYQAVGINFMLDYAWRSVEYFDNNSVISLRLGF